MGNKTNPVNNTAATVPPPPVRWWGSAATTRDKDGIAKKYTAVVYTADKSGYQTEADYFRFAKTPDCPNRSYAIVRAVNAAIRCGMTVDATTAERYAAALELVRGDENEKAEKALRAAKDKADATAIALANVAVDAAAALEKVTNIG